MRYEPKDISASHLFKVREFPRNPNSTPGSLRASAQFGLPARPPCLSFVHARLCSTRLSISEPEFWQQSSTSAYLCLEAGREQQEEASERGQQGRSMSACQSAPPGMRRLASTKGERRGKRLLDRCTGGRQQESVAENCHMHLGFCDI